MADNIPIMRQDEFENITWVLDQNGTLTISGEGDMPDWEAHYFKTEPADTPWRRYDFNQKIKKVVIKSGITTVGQGAFDRCFNIKEVLLPDGIKYINECAFNACCSLQSINLPDSVEGICPGAFYSCSDLKRITFPENLIFIEDSAFMKCGLEYVNIPCSTKRVGCLAFWKCTNLKEAYISESVEEELLGDVFEFCSNLESINVHSENRRYSSTDGVLFDKKQTEIICYPPNKSGKYYKIPSTVEHITTSAFRGCDDLTSIYIPESVTEIDFYPAPFLMNCSIESIEVSEDNQNYSAVDGVLFNKEKTALLCYPSCKKEDFYNVPDSVREIGPGAFYNNPYIEGIHIPHDVKRIDKYAFIICDNLEKFAQDSDLK